MKKASIFLMGIILSLLLIFAPVIDARDKSLTFSWEQTLDSTILGWNLYVKQGSSGGGVLSNYTLVAQIPWDGTELIEYESTSIIASTDGEENTFFFVITAYDEDNESSASNEVSKLIDFLAPRTPIRFKIKLK